MEGLLPSEPVDVEARRLHLQASMESGYTLPLLAQAHRESVERAEGRLDFAVVPKGTIMWACDAVTAGGPALEGSLVLGSLSGAAATCPPTVPLRVMGSAPSLVAYRADADIWLIDMKSSATRATVKVLSRRALPDVSAGWAIGLATGIAATAAIVGSPLFLALLLPVAAAAHVAARRHQQTNLTATLEHRFRADDAAASAAASAAADDTDDDAEIEAAKQQLQALSAGEDTMAIRAEMQAHGFESIAKAADAVISQIACGIPATLEVHGFTRRTELELEPAPAASGKASGLEALRRRASGPVRKSMYDEVFICPRAVPLFTKLDVTKDFTPGMAAQVTSYMSKLGDARDAPKE